MVAMDLHRTTDELVAGLPGIDAAPRQEGTLAMIVRRPSEDQRDVIEEGTLDLQFGLTGDNWIERPSRDMPDGSAHPERQLTVMSARAVELVAGPRDRWPLAGDQLYVDLDIGVQNLPAGSTLQIGSAVIEITEPPHNGCAKFTARFGLDAMHFVNSPEGKLRRLRGANARVLVPGAIREGDAVTVAARGEGQAQPPA